jgi:hypothetical protein
VLPVIGETISHYKILSKLGEGGMGEVYLAEDESLAREVAIKVLPEAFTRDRERLARFEREARTLAALEHPNIAAIYGLEQVDGRQLLIMQLALGKTLAARLAGGPIPAGEAIPMALQIAEALEAAHETGIVHRDLKPANVVVTDEGRVKVLDFGLAKTLEPDSSSGLEPLLSESPTLANQMTEPGVVLGTRAYMSPEQARGKPVDKRTDIWSFGCLLFEMLSSHKAFEGETGTDTLAAILEHEPRWEGLPENVPTGIQHLVQRCLRKDPKDRLRDIGDARIELADMAAGAREVVSTPEATTAAPSIRRRLWLPGLLILAVLVAVIAVWQLLPKERVVYLIDTTAPLGVYDPETRRAGGTNADDLTDALGDLPLTLIKESSSPSWRREHQVLVQHPDLILVHLNAFAHQPGFDEYEGLGDALDEVAALGLEDPMELGRSKLVAFLGYIALGSPHTQFVVYSRGFFEDEAYRARWVSEAVTRFPELEGRIVTYDVPGQIGVATYRDPATADEIADLAASILGID